MTKLTPSSKNLKIVHKWIMGVNGVHPGVPAVSIDKYGPIKIPTKYDGTYAPTNGLTGLFRYTRKSINIKINI